MRFRTPDEIRGKFAELRATCDPLGFDVLDELERACLADNAMMALQDRIEQLQNELAGIGGPLGELIPFPGHSVKVGEPA